MFAPEIVWNPPWRAILSEQEMFGVQSQLEREITVRHPLSGRGATAVGRRIDRDDVLVVFRDGTYANVHLVWGRTEPYSDKYPLWFAYGMLQDFLSAMDKDAEEYRAD
jgi:hypothetical protein